MVTTQVTPDRLTVMAELLSAIECEGATVEGWRNGRPLVQRSDGKAGLITGVTYLIPDLPYDDREAFDPRMEG